MTSHRCPDHDPNKAHTEVEHTHDLTQPQQIRQDIFQDQTIGAMRHVWQRMHNVQPLNPGEQWTIPVHFDCGFAGTIILQVDALGECKPDMSDDAVRAIGEKLRKEVREHGHGRDLGSTDDSPPTAEEIRKMIIQATGQPDQTN
jgi:hypothetical protein